MLYAKYDDRIVIRVENKDNLYTKLKSSFAEFSKRFGICYTIMEVQVGFDITILTGECEVLSERLEPYPELEVKFKVKDKYSLFGSDDYILNISEKNGKFRMNLSVSYVFEFIKD